MDLPGCRMSRHIKTDDETRELGLAAGRDLAEGWRSLSGAHIENDEDEWTAWASAGDGLAHDVTREEACAALASFLRAVADGLESAQAERALGAPSGENEAEIANRPEPREGTPDP